MAYLVKTIAELNIFPNYRTRICKVQVRHFIEVEKSVVWLRLLVTSEFSVTVWPYFDCIDVVVQERDYRTTHLKSGLLK